MIVYNVPSQISYSLDAQLCIYVYVAAEVCRITIKSSLRTI